MNLETILIYVTPFIYLSLITLPMITLITFADTTYAKRIGLVIGNVIVISLAVMVGGSMIVLIGLIVSILSLVLGYAAMNKHYRNK